MPQTRALGSTGQQITTVGLGTWAMGGPGQMGWGPQSDADSVKTILHAVEAGINWIDTAPVYGHGHSETIVGRALRMLPEAQRPLVFSKCGLLWDERRNERNDLTPASIKRECGSSLRRLGIEHLDLFQIHEPAPDGPPIEESWGAMLELVQEGKTRAVGLSNCDVTLLERCEAVGHVDSLQPPLSLIRREAASAVIPWCAAHQTGVIVYGPLQAGLLSGAFTAARAAGLTDDDWRSRDEEFRDPKLSRNLALQAAIERIADERAVSPAVIAIAWTTAWPGVSGAIVGARAPEQIDGWIDAIDVTLTAAELATIREALGTTGAGNGPTHP